MAISPKSTAAVVAAAGSGQRMGGEIPKQLLEVRGRPILVRALQRLECVDELGSIVLVVHPSLLKTVEMRLSEWNFRKIRSIVAGGAERQESVRRGLQALPEDAEMVLIHDAVRPFVSAAKIREVLAAAEEDGAAILAVPVKNTIKRGNGDWVEATIDRSGLWEVQTPQAFRRDILAGAFAKAAADGFIATDESLLVERLGRRVRIVVGEEFNIKITSPVDLRLAEILAAEEACA